MTIIQLEYLLAVANCGSFSLAAEHCFVTQPSLSMQIKSLEEELGVVLLDRSKKPVIPTEAGEVVLAEIRETSGLTIISAKRSRNSKAKLPVGCGSASFRPSHLTCCISLFPISCGTIPKSNWRLRRW